MSVQRVLQGRDGGQRGLQRRHGGEIVGDRRREAFGAGVGVLYSVTTISGPPLAIALNNQGLEKREFRAALGVVLAAGGYPETVRKGDAIAGLDAAAALPHLDALREDIDLARFELRRGERDQR